MLVEPAVVEGHEDDSLATVHDPGHCFYVAATRVHPHEVTLVNISSASSGVRLTPDIWRGAVQAGGASRLGPAVEVVDGAPGRQRGG